MNGKETYNMAMGKGTKGTCGLQGPYGKSVPGYDQQTTFVDYYYGEPQGNNFHVTTQQSTMTVSCNDRDAKNIYTPGC